VIRGNKWDGKERASKTAGEKDVSSAFRATRQRQEKKAEGNVRSGRKGGEVKKSSGGVKTREKKKQKRVVDDS